MSYMTEAELKEQAGALAEAQPRIQAGDLNFTLTAPSGAAEAVARRIPAGAPAWGSVVGHHIVQPGAGIVTSTVWVVWMPIVPRDGLGDIANPTVEGIFATEVEALRFGFGTQDRRVTQLPLGCNVLKELQK